MKVIYLGTLFASFATNNEAVANVTDMRTRAGYRLEQVNYVYAHLCPISWTYDFVPVSFAFLVISQFC